MNVSKRFLIKRWMASDPNRFLPMYSMMERECHAHESLQGCVFAKFSRSSAPWCPSLSLMIRSRMTLVSRKRRIICRISGRDGRDRRFHHLHLLREQEWRFPATCSASLDPKAFLPHPWPPSFPDRYRRKASLRRDGLSCRSRWVRGERLREARRNDSSRQWR